jgi:hypothetical protein
LDFDRFLREQETGGKSPASATPIKMKVMGEEYTLPPAPPAITVLASWREEKRTVKDVFAAGDAIFGKEALTQWARAGWSVDRIVEAVQVAERLILGESPEDIMLGLGLPTDTEEGEKKGSPAESTESSDAVGSASKPRSKRNTEST